MTIPQRRVFQKGETLFKEGDSGNEAYLLQSGSIRLFKTVGGRRIDIALVQPPAIVGEVALLGHAPRMASALALERTTCLVLPKGFVDTMLGDAAPGLVELIRSLVQTTHALGEDLARARAQLLDG